MVKIKHEEELGVDLCYLELSKDRRGNCWLCETRLGCSGQIVRLVHVCSHIKSKKIL
jgi:hypothetical protein